MKINTLVYLALLGHITCNEEESAEAESEETVIPWFWNSEDAQWSEDKDAKLNPPLETSSEGGSILSACFGLQSCAGFRKIDTIEEPSLVYAAREEECATFRTQTENGRYDTTSALALLDFELICPQITDIELQARPYDTMHITFNYPVVYDSLDVNGENFVFTLSDDTFYRPKCALMEPAHEGNEQHMVTLIGHFGSRETSGAPKKLRIEGDLKLVKPDTQQQIEAAGLFLDQEAGGSEWVLGNAQYGHGLSYEAPLVMLKAWMYPFSDTGETAENHCRVDFESTTHVIKIMFNGPVTKDGYHPIVPSDTDLFNVVGAPPQLEAISYTKFLGIADLGTTSDWADWPQDYKHDGDNYIDLCLALVDADNGGENLYTVSVGENVIFKPSGTASNIGHQVLITHVNDGTYPYNIEGVKTFDEQILAIYAAEIERQVTIGIFGFGGIIVVPLIGVGLAVGLMFLQSYIKMPNEAVFMPVEE